MVLQERRKKEKLSTLFIDKNVLKFPISTNHLTPFNMRLLGGFEKIRDFFEKIGIKRKKNKMYYVFWGNE